MVLITLVFAWEAYDKGSEVHLQADPTKLELLYKSFKVKKEDFKEQQKESILEKVIVTKWYTVHFNPLGLGAVGIQATSKPNSLNRYFLFLNRFVHQLGLLFWAYLSETRWSRMASLWFLAGSRPPLSHGGLTSTHRGFPSSDRLAQLLYMTFSGYQRLATKCALVHKCFSGLCLHHGCQYSRDQNKQHGQAQIQRIK